MGEWLKPAVLKTVWPERVTGVRIPPPPPENCVEVTEIFLSLKNGECMSLLSQFYPNGVENRWARKGGGLENRRVEIGSLEYTLIRPG